MLHRKFQIRESRLNPMYNDIQVNSNIWIKEKQNVSYLINTWFIVRIPIATMTVNVKQIPTFSQFCSRQLALCYHWRNKRKSDSLLNQDLKLRTFNRNGKTTAF